MRTFHTLSEQENQELQNFPVYISLLAMSEHETSSADVKKEAVRFAHTKTFSCDPLLIPFYQQADKDFEEKLITLNEKLPLQKTERINMIKEKLQMMEPLLNKMGEPYAGILRKSMESFKEHVSRAHHNVLAEFVFPMPMPGMTV